MWLGCALQLAGFSIGYNKTHADLVEISGKINLDNIIGALNNNTVAFCLYPVGIGNNVMILEQVCDIIR